MKQLRGAFLIYLKGMAMGGADVVPGVSGGTIALITGIYGRLLAAIASVDKEALSLLIKFRIKELFAKLDMAFLLPMLLGIATSILTLAKAISYLLENHPITVWSFFFGLIVASTLVVSRTVRKWRLQELFFLLLGLCIAFAITSLSPASTPEALWFIFLSGFIAISAMILPGISGSFILVLLGKYEYVLNALTEFKFIVILTFIFGCLAGILSISRGISWMLRHFYTQTIALLAGFMLGSLNKVWPWKKVTEFIMDRHGNPKPLVEENLMPHHYMDATSQDPLILEALFFAAIGFGLVVLLERIAAKIKTPNA